MMLTHGIMIIDCLAQYKHIRYSDLIKTRDSKETIEELACPTVIVD